MSSHTRIWSRLGKGDSQTLSVFFLQVFFVGATNVDEWLSDLRRTRAQKCEFEFFFFFLLANTVRKREKKRECVCVCVWERERVRAWPTGALSYTGAHAVKVVQVGYFYGCPASWHLTTEKWTTCPSVCPRGRSPGSLMSANRSRCW